MTKIRFVDVLKSFAVPGIVPLHYTVDGVGYTAKVKAGNTALECPMCGGMTPELQTTRRGLACRSCAIRIRATVDAEPLNSGIGFYGEDPQDAEPLAGSQRDGDIVDAREG